MDIELDAISWRASRFRAVRTLPRRSLRSEGRGPVREFAARSAPGRRTRGRRRRIPLVPRSRTAATSSASWSTASPKTRASLLGKCLNSVVVDPSAASAISRTLTRSKPRRRNSSMAASASAWQVAAFFRSRRPIAPPVMQRTVQNVKQFKNCTVSLLFSMWCSSVGPHSATPGSSDPRRRGRRALRLPRSRHHRGPLRSDDAAARRGQRRSRPRGPAQRDRHRRARPLRHPLTPEHHPPHRHGAVAPTSLLTSRFRVSCALTATFLRGYPAPAVVPRGGDASGVRIRSGGRFAVSAGTGHRVRLDLGSRTANSARGRSSPERRCQS